MIGLVLIGALVAGQFENVTSAASFVNSIGVNIHLSYWKTPYGTRFREVASALRELGIHHVRDGVTLGQQRACEEARQLATESIKFTYITQPVRTQADLISWTSCVGSAIEAYEAPNEYDISHPASDTNWVGTIRMFQPRLYSWVHTAPTLRGLEVVGPSLTSRKAFLAVGDLSSALDFGNMHDYFGGHEPGTRGYGDGGYGSIAYNLASASAVSGTKPVEATETGYGTGSSAGDVPEAIQASYVPRMFLEQYAAGVPRTFEYELVDEGGAPFGKLGLLDGKLRKKPAFQALEGMINLLSSGPTEVANAKVQLTISGDTVNVRHMLLQTGPSDCYLAIWQSVPSFEPAKAMLLQISQRKVEVSVNKPWAIARTLTYNEQSVLMPTDTGATTGSAPLAIADKVVFVEIVRDK